MTGKDEPDHEYCPVVMSSALGLSMKLVGVQVGLTGVGETGFTGVGVVGLTGETGLTGVVVGLTGETGLIGVEVGLDGETGLTGVEVVGFAGVPGLI